MKLDHIPASINIIDMQTSFVPDMGAVYGPATNVMPIFDNTSPEIVLIGGLTICAIAAVAVAMIGIKIWRGM